MIPIELLLGLQDLAGLLPPGDPATQAIQASIEELKKGNTTNSIIAYLMGLVLLLLGVDRALQIRSSRNARIDNEKDRIDREAARQQHIQQLKDNRDDMKELTKDLLIVVKEQGLHTAEIAKYMGANNVQSDGFSDKLDRLMEDVGDIIVDLKTRGKQGATS